MIRLAAASEGNRCSFNLGATDEETHEQAESALFGFWVFLMSDAVIFALLFATYGVMLPAAVGGPTPASECKIAPAFVETLILLTSSFTYGMASIAMKHGAPAGRCSAGWERRWGSASYSLAWNCTIRDDVRRWRLGAADDVGERVDLRGPVATRAADRLSLSPPFAPNAERCAFT